MEEVSHSGETKRLVAMARQGRSSRLGLERLVLLAQWGGGGGRRGGVEEGGSSSAGFAGERVQRLLLLPEERKEREIQRGNMGRKQRETAG